MKWIAVLGLLAGCIDVHLVECADNIACPIGDLCDDLHHGCATPEQLAVCSGHADGDGCIASSINGGCFGGVCLPRGCGNRVVEPGEVCDDGNQVSGDGCRSDCQSSETCGNGVRDPGEECDDGNLMSRDGCDSRCLVEHVTWTDLGLPPSSTVGGIYDEARGRLVVPTPGPTWEWDGHAWSVHAVSIGSLQATYYDPDRKQVVVIASGSNLALQAFGWDGTHWTAFTTQGPTTLFVRTATYDRARHRPVIVVYGPSPRVWTFDATGEWSTLTDVAISGNAYLLPAFDPETQQVVIIHTLFPQPEEWAFDGTTWTFSTTGFSTTSLLTSSLAVDPTTGHLAIIDDSNNLWERVAGVWQFVVADPTVCPAPTDLRTLYAGPAGLVLAEPHGLVSCERAGGAWVTHAIDLPLWTDGVAPDPAHHRFIIAAQTLTGIFETWSWDRDGWHRLVTAHSPTKRSYPVITYDPALQRVVLFGGIASTGPELGDTWTFDGDDWTLLDDSGPSGNVTALGYDPSRRRLLLGISVAGVIEIWERDDGAATWTRQATNLNFFSTSFAWDARNARMVAFAGGLVELVGDVWIPAQLVPLGGYSALGDPRTGDLLLLSRSSFGPASWERDGDQWHLIAAPPVGIFGMAAADPIDGRVLEISSNTSAPGGFIRELASATPLETCEPGVDADGDGLIGCADPDCAWSCTPACPPYTTCP